MSLLEVLAVAAIIAVLAALLLPLLISAKRKAQSTTDASNMRQIYFALTLYEGDHSEQMPPSLSALTGTYCPAEILESRLDPRSFDAYPANLYFEQPMVTSPVVPYKVSYGYLRAFESRFSSTYGITWSGMRNRADVGLLVSAWNCWLDEPGVIQSETLHGKLISRGVLMRICMDGSLKNVPRGKWGVSRGGSYEELFLRGTASFDELFLSN